MIAAWHEGMVFYEQLEAVFMAVNFYGIRSCNCNIVYDNWILEDGSYFIVL